MSLDQRQMSATFLGDLLEVEFRVQETYKGTSTSEVVVFTNSSEAACGFPFSKGEQYVVYGTEYAAKLFTSICQRTRPVRFAVDDLAYLRKMGAAPNTSTVFGNYKRYTFDPNFVPKFTPSIMDHYRPPEEEYRAMAPMTGERVILTSAAGEKRQVAVDKDGKFSFVDLPPGKYKIEVSVPPQLSQPLGYVSGLGFRPESMDVPAKGCAEVTFRTQPDGQIAGRILDATGKPLAHVQVIVWDTREKFNFYRGASRVYDSDDGTFNLGPLPPGKYVLGAYVWVLPQGFPAMADERERLTEATTRFFPDATNYGKAAPIDLGFGQHISNIELRIPFNPDNWKYIKGNQ